MNQEQLQKGNELDKAIGRAKKLIDDLEAGKQKSTRRIWFGDGNKTVDVDSDVFSKDAAFESVVQNEIDMFVDRMIFLLDRQVKKLQSELEKL